MAKQEPQQPFFIPRVAGVTHPPPKPQPQPEVQAPVKAFQSTAAAPPAQLKPEARAAGEAVFRPRVAAPPPPAQLKPEVQAPAEAVPQPTVAPPTPSPQLKPQVHASAEAVLQPTVASPTPPPQLKPEVQAPAEAVPQPTVVSPTPPPPLKPQVQTPAEVVLQPTVASPSPPQIGRTPFAVPPKRQGSKGMLISVLIALFLCTAVVVWVALTPSLRQQFQELTSPKKTGADVKVADLPPSQTAPQSPPMYPEGASRVEDKEIGFSFAIPDGYLAASKKASNEQYLFERKLFTEPKRTILIKKVNGEYPGGSSTTADLPALLDGHAVSTVTFNWRGHELSGSRSLDPNLAKPFVVFSAVIPLREQRILLEVSGSEESEAVIREVMDLVLGSLGD